MTNNTDNVNCHSTMICLVGEQPEPNLLPIKFCRPSRVVLIFSNFTKRVANNLSDTLKTSAQIENLQVEPYDVIEIERAIEDFIVQRELESSSLSINFTGGTKQMSLAAFRVAERRHAAALYLQTEGGKSQLYFYGFSNGELILSKREIINATLKIEDYLSAHGLHQDTKSKAWEKTTRDKGFYFAKAVAGALRGTVSELREKVRFREFETLELDLVLRHTNQFGIAEIKTGKEADKKAPIEQLNSATAREFLGIYTKKILITDRELTKNNKLIAQAYNITHIALCDELVNNSLSRSDGLKLKGTVNHTLAR